MTKFCTNLRLIGRLVSFVVATLVLRVFFEIALLTAGPKRRIDVINWWVPRWSGVLLRIFGIRVEARGPHADQGRLYPGKDERGVGRIFVANHRSGTDIPVAFTLVAAHAISRHDLATWPIIGSGARRIGTLFVDRSNRRSGAAALRQIADALAAGEGVLMFPEGTAHLGDEVRELKPGAFTTAVRSGAQIVPLGIAYADPAAYYTQQSFMEHMKQLRVAVELGEPLQVEEALVAKEVVRERLQQLVDLARQRLGGERHDSPSTSGQGTPAAAEEPA
jgi:1-acyl-sn-glycerol-3-phosphate acyltransferase